MKLAFANNLPWPVAVALVLVGVGLVVWFYQRHAADVPRRYLRWLLILRVLAVLLVLMFFLRPRFSWTRTEGRKRRVALLVDVSKSMSVRDTPGLPERLERVKDVFSQNKVIERLEEAFDVALYAFSGEPEGVPEKDGLPSLQPLGSHTDIAGALKALQGGQFLEAAVCVSDGNHNAAGDPVEEARRLARPVFAVGVGLPEGEAAALKDIEVRDAVSSGRAVLNSRTTVAVRVEARGFAGLHTQVLIRDSESGSVLGQAPLVLDDVVGEQEVEVEFTPDKEGLLGLEVEVRAEPNEAIAENNSVRFVVDVSKSALKVLYVEGVVGPDGKWLRRLLLKDPDVQAVALVRVGQNKFISQGEVEGLSLKGLPEERGVLGRFDVFVLNNVPADVVGAANLETLKSLVGEGRGLLLMPGDYSFGPGGYHTGPLVEILPAAFGEGAPVTGGFPLSVPKEAPSSPLSRMLRDAEAAGVLGHFQLLHAARSLPAGETLLAVSNDAEVLAGNPVLVVGKWEKGRAAALLGGPTYPWRSSPQVYRGFWGSLLRYLAGKEAVEAEQGSVALLVEKPEFALGETLSLAARVRDDDGALTDAALVVVEWHGPGGEGRALLASTGAGEYRGAMTPPDVGTYSLVAAAEQEGEKWESGRFDIEVRRVEAEFQKIGLDRDLLAALAAGSGGAYLDLDRAGELPGLLESALEVKKVPMVLNPARSGLLYLLLVCLISAEWYVRRRLELP